MGETFIIAGKEFFFTTLKGTATGSKKTLASSGGNLSAGRPSTPATPQQDIWIQGDTGKEIVIRLNNCDVPIIAGQRISVLCIECEGKSHCVCIVNHTTGTHHSVYTWQKFIEDYKLPLPISGLPYALCVIGATGIIGNVLNFWVGAAVGGLVWCGMGWMLYQRKTAYKKIFLEYLDKAVAEAR